MKSGKFSVLLELFDTNEGVTSIPHTEPYVMNVHSFEANNNANHKSNAASFNFHQSKDPLWINLNLFSSHTVT